jgi:hypothetical protein
MKLKLLLLAVLTASTALAADSVPLFNALLSMGKEQRFVLVGEDGKSSSWLKLGDNFAGFTLKSYDVATTTLALDRDGKTVAAVLVNGAGVKDVPAPTPATLADAQQVFRVMRFDEMMAKMIEQQKKTMAPMISQSMAAAAQRMKLTPEEKEQFMAIQQKGIEDMMNSLTGPDMKASMAQAYSEIFSKEELDGLSAFYATPTGQALIDKTPEVSTKMQQVMLPKMQQSMMQMQQAVQGFAIEIKARHAAAAAAAASAAPADAPALPVKP